MQTLAQRKEDIVRAAAKKILPGFCKVSELSHGEKSCILSAYPEGFIFRLCAPTSHGDAKFSTYDFLGYNISRMHYVVVDQNRFNRYLSQKLEVDFIDRNPIVGPRGMRTAFTHFMHSNGLHWTLCCLASKELEKR